MADHYFEKTETEDFAAKFQAARLLEFVRESGREYQVNDYVRPSTPNGFAYRCATAGQSSSKSPKWKTAIAASTNDGSAVWETVAVDANSTDSISSVNLVTPTGITAGTPTISGTRILFDISGGEKGRTYEISVEITTASSEVFEEKLNIRIKGE